MMKKRNEDLLLKYSYKISTKDILFVTSQIETFLKAGVNLTKAISNISKSHPNKRLKKILKNVNNDINAGVEFSVALSKYPDVFDTMFVSLIEAGEMSGSTESVFNKLARYLERMNALRSSLSSAMIYPMFLVVFMFLIVFFMMKQIVPVFAEMYNDTGGDFPLLTRYTINVSDFVTSYHVVIILSGVLIFLLYKLAKTKLFTRTIMDRVKINFPILGSIIRLIVISRIMSTISMMLNSGISIITCFKTSGKTSNNEIYKKAMKQIASDVSLGKDVSKSFKKTKLFPNLVISFIETAENTGTLNEMSEKISDYFETESKYKIKEFSSIIEPLLLVVLGLITALLVVSIYLPIMTFGQEFQKF